MEQHTRIVILGGGFGGVAAAKKLHRQLRGKNVQITLVDRSDHHVFNPLLYEVATGFIEHGESGTAKLFDSGVVMGYRSMLARWGVDFVNATVTGLDWETKKVILDGHDDLTFDHVLIALGSETNYYGINGLKEYASTLKSVEEADVLRRHVHKHLHRAESRDEERFDAIIGGAGATGVELAGELMLFLRKHIMKGHIEPKNVSIALIQAAPKVLPVMEDPIPGWVLARLEQLGIKVYLDTAISSVAEHKVTICPRPLREGEDAASLVCDLGDAKEKVIQGDIIVWTGGVRGPAILEKLGVPTEGRGKRIKVGADFRIAGREGGWAIGDCVDLPHPVSGAPTPWLAQAAIAQGKSAGEQIVASIMGKTAKPYRFRSYASIVTVGGKWAIVQGAGMRFKGSIVWFLRAGADLRYFLSVLPVTRALRVWWNGVIIYSQND